MLKRSEKIAREMIVRDENVRKNLERSKKFTITEPLMYTLVSEGIGRQDAHELLSKYSDYMYDHMGENPIDVLHGIPEIRAKIEKSKIEKLFREHGGYTGLSEKYTTDVIKAADQLFKFDV